MPSLHLAHQEPESVNIIVIIITSLLVVDSNGPHVEDTLSCIERQVPFGPLPAAAQ